MASKLAGEQQELLGLEPEQARGSLDEFFESRGAPPYRTDQVIEAIYRGEREFDAITNLKLEERQALDRRFTLTPLEVADTSESADGTVKHLWRLADGEMVESVLIPAGDRLTLCISSQAGCALGCVFCATGHYGLQRNLSGAEIVAQFREAREWARARSLPEISNVVYMGMGEPFANRPAVFASLSVLNHGFGFGARRITVSTVGLVPGILELARRPEQFRLAVSLHAPTHELRARLVPIEQHYPLDELMEALRQFVAAGGKRLTFEYTLIRGVNDSPQLADRLARLVKEFRPLVNLIPFNPIPYVAWRPSEPAAVEAFRARLEAAGISAAVREPRGRDVAAACGQLRAMVVGNP